MVTTVSSRPRRRTESAASSRDSTSTASPGFSPWRSTKRRNAGVLIGHPGDDHPLTDRDS